MLYSQQTKEQKDKINRLMFKKDFALQNITSCDGDTLLQVKRFQLKYNSIKFANSLFFEYQDVAVLKSSFN